MPVADEATLEALRYTIGHLKTSALPGEPGLGVYLGHRMIDHGRHFNRLPEVEEGDLIQIDDGKTLYTYTVTRQESISPRTLEDRITETVDGSQILLVTCEFHDPNVTEYNRIVVYATLTRDRMRSKKGT